MEHKNEVCEICLHTITNPVCVDCYIRHAESWLKDFGLNEKQVRVAIEKIKARLPKETLNAHRCILCGKGTVAVCSFCSFLRTSDVILSLCGEKAPVKAYLESSNFDLERDSR